MSKSLLVLAVLWLIFATLHEVLTGQIWFWVLPGLAPPILFAIPPAIFALSSLSVKRFRLLVLALAIGAFLISIPSTGINFNALAIRETSATGEMSVHVVQMNTDYWGQLREGTLTDPRDKEAMLTFLRALDADVYLLQEHMSRDGDFAPPVTDLSDVAEKFPEYKAITAGTLLTLTRLPVVNHSIVNPHTSSDLHLPPPPYGLKVNVSVGNEVLSTYNVHMPIQIIIEKNWFSAAFYNEIWRRHFIRQNEFHVLTQDVAKNPLPLVIAGDFNTSPAMGDNRGLLDVVSDAASFSSILYPATWRVGGQLPKLWRTDWFLIRNNITVDRFQSLDPEGNSDHLVQSVGLSLSKAATHAAVE